MKKLLSLFTVSTITLVGVSSVVACDSNISDDRRYFEDATLKTEILNTLNASEPLEVYDAMDLVSPLLETYATSNYSKELRNVGIRSIYYSFIEDDDDNLLANDIYSFELKELYDFSTLNFAIEIEYEQKDSDDNEWDWEYEGISFYNIDFVLEDFRITRITDEVEFSKNDSMDYIYNEVLEKYSVELFRKNYKEIRNTKDNPGLLAGALSNNDVNIEIKKGSEQITQVSQLSIRDTYDVTISSKENSKISLENGSTTFKITLEKDD